MSKRQFILRLDPNDPDEARLIERLERARKTTWGGVQRVLKEALLQFTKGTQAPTGVTSAVPVKAPQQEKVSQGEAASRWPGPGPHGARCPG